VFLQRVLPAISPSGKYEENRAADGRRNQVLVKGMGVAA